jgi:hypothetical protein
MQKRALYGNQSSFNLEIYMKTYQFVKKAGQYSFNKQESIVFAALQELKDASIEELAAKCMELGLRTKQSPERIVAYYLVDLRKLGLVKSTGTSAKKVTIVIGDDEEDDADEQS